MKKIIPLLLALIAAYFSYQNHQPEADSVSRIPGSTSPSLASREQASQDALIADAFRKQQSNTSVTLNGTVIALLSDDNDGSRHQRFIIKLASGQTLLVAHNIDLAGRVENLKSGDSVSLRGEYEWNNKGGVLHWTHHDPSQRHETGWIRHEGHTYQ